MDNVIISDTSCLIALAKISRLPLLQQLFSSVVITPQVFQEFGEDVPSWILIKSPRNQDRVHDLSAKLDLGEATSIALGLETKNAILIIDERKGRNIALGLGLEVIGTLRILLFAKQQKLVSELRPIIDDLQKHGFRFSKTIIDTLLAEANEL